MRIPLTAGSLLVLLVARPVSTAARPAESDQHAVEALEHQWLWGEHDRAALDTILADDFIHPVTAGVFLTKSQHIGWAVSHPAPADRRRRFDGLRIRVYGQAAVATGTVVSIDRAGHEDRTVFTDVFVRRNGRWQAVNAQENAVQRTR